MSCMIATLQGGDPCREIFPLSVDRMADLHGIGLVEICDLLGVQRIEDLPLTVIQHVGAAFKPDSCPFYLTTIAPDFGPTLNPVGYWRGGFFAPFGFGDIVGTVEGDLLPPGGLPTKLHVKARLLLDDGGPAKLVRARAPYVSVDWEVHGSQATRPNKSSIIGSVKIHDPGPHTPEDIRRCVALHAPQRCFGEPRAIIAMQCGVAAAALIEAIC